jgi:glutamate-5-semialdehyde dehydrogenase
MSDRLESIQPGMTVLYDGDRLARVPDEIAARFQSGDKLLVVSGSGDVLHIPRSTSVLVRGAVDAAYAAFQCMGTVRDDAVARFYQAFAERLADDAVWGRVVSANAGDVESARARSRPTTRLQVSEKMRRDMIEGLQVWRRLDPIRDSITATVQHDGWKVDQVLDGLGVVGFVFEGRPNVFADATGILRSGNTAVLRIGGDALRTARAIEVEALRPALCHAGMPEGAITLIDSAERAAGWALFSDSRLALAVARGSGGAVAQLGSVARQAGVPVSLHGTGGAWLVGDTSADRSRFAAALYHSLDRKVCNTANVVLIVEARAAELLPIALTSLGRRGERQGVGYKLHVLESAVPYLPKDIFTNTALIQRAGGAVEEPIAEPLAVSELGREWEWDHTPELSIGVVSDLDEAIRLFNTYSPRFAASLIAEDASAQAHFFRAIDAPFVGDGFTRWVDGQYALDRPELGLSNWQGGRLFGRGGVLSGNDVRTVRLRMYQIDPELHR